MAIENLSFETSRRAVRKYLISICLVVTLVILAVFGGFYLRTENLFREQLVNNGRSFFEGIVMTRLWLASHEGVYIRKTPGTEVNPYLAAIPGLKLTLRDADGQLYILKNPALVTREISQIAEGKGVLRFHITSLNPVNPSNAPDAFERRALGAFAKGEREDSTFEKTDQGQVFRYMAPLVTEVSCLRCHEAQGYRAGDVRGGISVTLPAGQTLRQMRIHSLYLAAAVMGVILFIVFMVYFIATYFIKDLRLAERKLFDMATTDALTGVYNRREGFRRLEAEALRASRAKTPLSVMMADIDHFKNINDTHGHQVGDEVLKRVASTLKNALRASDMLCRYGGEEFLILATETDLDNVKRLAERLRLIVEEMSITLSEGVEIKVTLSFGVAQYLPQETHEYVIFRADQALYQAKQNGRNRVCVG